MSKTTTSGAAGAPLPPPPPPPTTTTPQGPAGGGVGADLASPAFSVLFFEDSLKYEAVEAFLKGLPGAFAISLDLPDFERGSLAEHLFELTRSEIVAESSFPISELPASMTGRIKEIADSVPAQTERVREQARELLPRTLPALTPGCKTITVVVFGRKKLPEQSVVVRASGLWPPETLDSSPSASSSPALPLTLPVPEVLLKNCLDEGLEGLAVVQRVVEQLALGGAADAFSLELARFLDMRIETFRRGLKSVVLPLRSELSKVEHDAPRASSKTRIQTELAPFTYLLYLVDRAWKKSHGRVVRMEQMAETEEEGSAAAAAAFPGLEGLTARLRRRLAASAAASAAGPNPPPPAPAYARLPRREGSRGGGEEEEGKENERER